MIVIIDSGIWISAMEFGGTPAAALDRGIRTDSIAVCAEIEDEVLGILNRKFNHDPQLMKDRLRPFLRDALRIEITGEVARRLSRRKGRLHSGMRAEGGLGAYRDR